MYKLKLAFILLFTSGIIYSQDVNPFTGSFSYGQNILHVPSNRGNGVDVSISYGAGIAMEQAASEIGLGWNIQAGGAIYRSVSGYPDDVKDFRTFSQTGIQLFANGALYHDNLSGAGRNDIFRSSRDQDTSEFTFPDFDSYQVVGPGFNGQMKLNYHKFYSFGYSLVSANPLEYDYLSNTDAISGSGYIRKPQFHFVGDFADTLVSRHYSVAIDGTTPFRIPTDNVDGNGYTNTSDPFIGRHYSGSTISDENFNKTSGRLGTSNFIEYFTNEEIDNANSSSFASGPLATFIDYKSSHARSSSNFPAEGIGYFRITTSNGLTYHYSLPVYHLESTTFKAPLKNDYSLESGIDVGNFISMNASVTHTENANYTIKELNDKKYAVKWLLTAITGADYVDSNNNHMVDDGDSGYWIYFDYEQWSSEFVNRFPEFGYDYQYSLEEYSKDSPIYFPFAPASPGSPYYKFSGLSGVTQISKEEKYHLNRIRTSSHTAIFVRDIRKDEKGGSADITIPSNFKPAPDLLLKRVVLFANAQIDSIMTALYPSGPGNGFTTLNYPEFDFTYCNPTEWFYSEDWFNTNFPYSNPNQTSYLGNNFNYCILKNVYFDQDYSLCKKYYGNVNVSYNNSSVLTSPVTVESNISVSDYSNSGKLTLNRIYTYDFGNEKVIPSMIFDYDKGNLIAGIPRNPDYNPRKADYWGFYKNDATDNGFSRYTTSGAKEGTKAWSLLKITDPMGGITEMEYESNSYNKVLDIESSTGFRGAAFIYRMKDVTNQSNKTSASFDIIMEEGANVNSYLSDFNLLCSGTISGLTKRMFLPMTERKDYDATAMSTVYKSLAFGNITTTIVNVPTGSSNNLTGTLTPIDPYNNNSRWAYVNKTSGGFSNKHVYANADAPIYNYYTSNSGDHAYTGNGYVFFETPIGYEVYGGGIRTKKIKRINSYNEVYVKEYTYTDGVATDEADRFEYPRLKTLCAESVLRYDYLRSKNYTKLNMSPMIGYSKVIVKDLGRINSDNGKIELSFIVDPKSEGGIFDYDHSITTYTSSATGKVNRLMECTNIFGNIFGAQKETKIYDKNDNMISRSVNVYTTTEQGALVEEVYFTNGQYDVTNSINSYSVNILRDIPVVLKESINYGMGTKQISCTLKRDELTGETTTMEGIAMNNSSSNTFKVPAYKKYQEIEHLDFEDASLRKMIPLGHDMFSYSNVDSTLTGTLANGYSNSFVGSAYNLLSKKARKRELASGLYYTTEVTLPYYYNNRSFVYDAGTGSNNLYGLLSKTTSGLDSLPVTALTHSVFSENNSSYDWRLTNEVTLLDYYKNVVETRDANNRYNAARYGYNGYYKSAAASNVNYPSFTFCDFETPPSGSTNPASIDGDLIINNHTFIPYTTVEPHSGSKCIQVTSTAITYSVKTQKSPGGTLDIGLLPGRIYRVGVWVHNTNLNKAEIQVAITGTANSTYQSTQLTANSTNNLIATIGNWNLIQMDFEIDPTFETGINDDVTISLQTTDGSTVYYDDFMFHPVESGFSASVYNPRNGRVSATLDENGFATKYKYDAAGRMTEVWKEIPDVGYKKIKKYTYNYARGANN